jgi:hypothetical protein
MVDIAINTFRRFDNRLCRRKLKWSIVMKNIRFFSSWQAVAASADDVHKIYVLCGNVFLIVNITINQVLKESKYK